MPVQLTKLDVETITTLQAVAAEPGVTLDALAASLGRDVENQRKTLKALEGAGRLARVERDDRKLAVALTDDGASVVRQWSRAHDPAPEFDGTAPFAEIPLDLIDEDPALNPRTTLDTPEDQEDLAGLAASIREKGVAQPILIRPGLTEGRFRVVAGARRRRASIAAGKATIPAVIRDLDDAQALEIAALENLQRKDMNPLDEATAFDRIIAARRAADPSLSLKAAKEAVSGAIGKTVRFIEQRLDLLELPPAKRQALAEGSFGLTEARKWLQSRPKLLTLTPRQWLIALEVYDAQERDPAPTRYDYEANWTRCGYEAANSDADEDLGALIAAPAMMLTEPQEILDEAGERTGRFRIRVPDHRLDQLRLKFGDVAEDDIRAKALVEARKACGSQDVPARKGKRPVYATEWLNGPFNPPPELAAAIEQEKAERKAREDERRRQAEAEAAERQAKSEAGLKRLGEALKILRKSEKGTLPDRERALNAILTEGGRPLPWFPTDRAGIRAANGETVIPDYPAHMDPAPDTVARVMLMAVAVNALAGLVTPTAPPTPVAQVETRPDDAEPGEKVGDVEPIEDEDEDEDDLEDASADADDDETPEFLRRLAGPGAPAEAAPTA